MPAARHDVGQLRPAHEGGVVAVAAGDLLHRAAQEQHRVGRLEARQGRKRELKLAGAELDLERPQRQAEGFEILSQNLHDRIDEIVALLGKVLIASGEKLHVRRGAGLDRKSTRLNSSHTVISYAVFCLKKKIKKKDL